MVSESVIVFAKESNSKKQTKQGAETSERRKSLSSD